MARLFIIGNGFDSAHGYKTAYKYFKSWCVQKLSELGWNNEEIPEIPFSSQSNHDDRYYDEDDVMKLFMWLLTSESDLENDPE